MNKDRNDPGRFFGDGVTFKAKLIGILEVGEARGDRMCQEALQDLKMAIRAAGEHKQRITIHVTIEGLRLRDEKTSDSLYHHPVHKISFIAQDMTDSRAFGYIFGSPDSGHRFFGIKTDKAASQVVLAMRDLFQVVFELKKKEIEMARQQIQSKIIHEHQPISLNVKSTGTDPLGSGYSKTSTEAGKSNQKEISPESVADLVDLEQELSSIQRGITQMERITPSEPSAIVKSVTGEDPFGDSFTSSFQTYQLLPPPESSRSRHMKVNKPSESAAPEVPSAPLSVSQPLAKLSSVTSVNPTAPVSDSKERWLEKDVDLAAVPFESQKHVEMPPTTAPATSVSMTSSGDDGSTDDVSKSQGNLGNLTSIVSNAVEKAQFIDAFTDLDPLGTGKSKPYVDKKYFFQELKNPPKKVLKDLSQKDSFAAFHENDSEQRDLFELGPESYEANMDRQSNENSSKSIPDKHLFAKDISSNLNHSTEKVFSIDLDRSKIEEPVMVKRDTDPFSPTRKKSDPFQEGDIFTKLDPFEFQFSGNKQTILPDTKIVSDEMEKPKKDMNMFNGPLQVSLPPEGWTSSMAQKKIERQTSESPTSSSRNRPSVFKQNTVDVISSISAKKMPHLFGQKFSKRDSNSINMRRLQESDSLSENEAAPEPPPRPDSASHVEPPPLPPKKQFTDIVIRPRITSSSAVPPPTRYDYVSSRMKSLSLQNSDSAPPIPLPSRRVGKVDSSYPGPGRPGRKPGEEEDYLTPISSHPDVPPLLPPPQTRTRARRYEYLDKTEGDTPPRSSESHSEPALPDITLSQLLTLGIDELAGKLSVPSSKLSTMTLVELTSYLSNFIENSKRTQDEPKRSEEPSVFKVNFDQNPEATFVAKFNDNFGEESDAIFEANFADFEMKVSPPTTTAKSGASQVPPADRYAVFREIIEQEKQNDDSVDSSGMEDEAAGEIHSASSVSDIIRIDLNGDEVNTTVPVTKIDTKITEAISHAKDRYAALRDIILVEDLFDKPARQIDSRNSNLTDSGDRDLDLFEIEDSKKDNNSPENLSSDGMERSDSGRKSAEKIKQDSPFMHTLTVSNTDDLEIDEYMHRALSNLSLDNRDRLTPGVNKSPSVVEVGTSPKPPSQSQSKSPIELLAHDIKSQFNDMSTSPIPVQKSPASKSPVTRSPHAKSPLNKSPVPQPPAVTSLIESKRRPDSGSLSDVIGSSPETDRVTGSGTEQPTISSTAALTAAGTAESWAIFEKGNDKKPTTNGGSNLKSLKNPQGKGLPESPCSSDAKEEWKGEQEYVKKWPKGQTSSSSRDLSPWDDETSDYKKRPPDRTDRHGYYMRHARRMNSCDDDYDYEDDVSKRRDRRVKGHISRSRENFDSDSQNWYHAGNHHHWSPPEDDEGGPRAFERNLYERGTYGPPLRDHKVAAHMSSYDRRYEKRKYYREYCRPEYEFESYGESPDVKDRKLMYYGDKVRRDYDNMYEEGFGREGRGSKPRDFFYERERKSFDRDSVESFDSAHRRQRSFGSGDVYGSLDSREEFRERYMGGGEKTRSLRKSIKMRSNEDYEPDSENGDHVRRGPGDSRSLQRPSQSARVRKSSGSSPWDGEDPMLGPVPPAAGQKGWKRPSSASESERRLAENRRVLSHTLSGSDGEKDRRFRRRSRPRGKDETPRTQQQSFSSYRHGAASGAHHDEIYDYMDYDEYGMPVDEDKFERLNRRRQDMHQRMMEADHSQRRKKGEKFTFDNDAHADESMMAAAKYGGGMKKDSSFYSEKDSRHSHKFDAFDEPPPSTKGGKCMRRGFDFDEFEETPRSNTSSGKFNFEEHGFESDFNSPPPSSTVVSSAATKSSFRFSNDFSDKEHKQNASPGTFDSDTPHQTPMQKLRFDDKITVSKFENDPSGAKPAIGAFEDDFSKTEFVLENEDRWTSELPKRNNNSRLLPKQRPQQDQIKKSESVNIFGRKSEDPFEDDDFFKAPSPPTTDKERSMADANGAGVDKRNKQSTDNGFNWDSNFAKFDENM